MGSTGPDASAHPHPPAAAAQARLACCPHFAWKTRHIGPLSVWETGSTAAVDRLAADLGNLGFEAAVDALALARDPFAAILEADDWIVATVDFCRSAPVFWARTREGGTIVGNRAETVRAAADATRVDPESVIEALSSGYVTGERTLYAQLFQLRSGEALHLDKKTGELRRRRYFLYQPALGSLLAAEKPEDEIALMDRLAATTDAAMEHLVTVADGRPIVVPLSGGLDSRLILAKLAAAGYPDLSAFSYGPKKNHDLRVAAEVAERLNVPWQAIELTSREIRAYYRSEARQQFAPAFADHAMAPFSMDMVPLAKMQRLGLLPGDAMIVNGQTGDFISGGHIPEALTGGDLESLYSAILNKHYSLWPALLQQHPEALWHRRIDQVLELGSNAANLELRSPALLFERWEYEERQAKFVIAGQRAYEFLGLAWHLPLWDGDFVRFWRQVPVSWKRGQRLYRAYLSRWNHAELFEGFVRPYSSLSPMLAATLLPVSWGIRAIAGRPVQRRVMRYADYFGRFSQHYLPFGFVTFARLSHQIRNPVSLYARQWIEQQGIPLPDGVPTAETDFLP